MDINEKGIIFITCAPGLTDCLRQEVEGLGFTVQSSHKAGVEITARLEDVMLLNLNLRTAFNVLFLLREFDCATPDELYKQVYDMRWEDVISPNEYISVVPRVDTPTIKNSMFASVKVKDAIVDRITKAVGRRPDSGSKRDHIVIHIYWKDDHCWLYLNTSGQKLSDRGYRKMPHTAPMQETLAAGVILTSGYDGGVPFVALMCGSGTLAIEAALIAAHKAQGLLRSNYGFMHIKDFDSEKWQNLRRETLKKSRKTLPFRIIATDIDEKAIYAAKKNALTAGVDHLIEFVTCDFADTPIPPEKGIVILNPEYGERLGQIRELEKTYERIGDFFKQKCAGYTGYIFTGNMALAKKVGLRASRRIPFFNGAIECRLLKYELYEGSREKEQ